MVREVEQGGGGVGRWDRGKGEWEVVDECC